MDDSGPRVRASRILLAVAGWTAYIVLASYLGMTGGDPTAFGGPAWRNMMGMWQESATADAIFVVGLVAVSTLACRIARAGHPWLSAGAAFVGAWLTFAIAFAVKSAQEGSDVVALAPVGLLMVLVSGWMGILFATAAPVALAKARAF